MRCQGKWNQSETARYLINESIPASAASRLLSCHYHGGRSGGGEAEGATRASATRGRSRGGKGVEGGRRTTGRRMGWKGEEWVEEERAFQVQEASTGRAIVEERKQQRNRRRR